MSTLPIHATFRRYEPPFSWLGRDPRPSRVVVEHDGVEHTYSLAPDANIDPLESGRSVTLLYRDESPLERHLRIAEPMRPVVIVDVGGNFEPR